MRKPVELRRVGDAWRCCATLSGKIPEDITKAWATRVSREPDYGNVPQTEDEGCLVSKAGLLQIPWPCLAEGGTAVTLDLLGYR